MNANERRALLEKAATLEWSAPLPATTDYRERAQQFDVPKELKNGFYFLISSHNAAFSDKDNQVSFSDFWVSELALILRARDQQVEGFVLDANSGEPLADAAIDAWSLNNAGNRVAHAPVKTDINGLFTLTANERGYLVRARHHGQELASAQDFWAYNYRNETPAQSQTIFFTDRAIYRPGQTVSYKGISLRFDQGRDDYKLLKGHDVVVVFADVNGKEIAKQTHRCNDYGSFSGSFTAPRDRLMGAMSLMAQGDAPGSASVRVEEYKRPKFQVKLEAPKTAAKLNERVSLMGKAESYTGAAIDGAEVKVRIVREVRWPIWWGWFSWRQPHVGASQEIAHGTARTETDGSFKVEFVAKPDASISPTNEPTFDYAIYADVTDSTGETRSADRSIRVGYTALQASLAADEWQTEDKPVEVTLKTSTLDDEPQTAEGSLKIYRLKEPTAVVRASLGDDYYFDTGQLIHQPDLADPNNWQLGDVVSEKGFTTDASGSFSTTFQLGVGAYRATVETQERFGKKVTALLPLKVLKPDDEKFGIKIPHHLAPHIATILRATG